MGHTAGGAVAKGVAREKLFAWYTDYSPEDVDIMKRRGDGRLLSRVCTRDGNKLRVENKGRGLRGKPMKFFYDAVLHPEDYTYDIHISVPGMMESDRHYTFTQEPEGARVAYEDNTHAIGRMWKFLAAIGIGDRVGAWASKRTLRAYVAEAESELGQKQ